MADSNETINYIMESKEKEEIDETYIVFDCETTGLDEKKDKIIQLSMIKVHPDGGKPDEIFDKYFNPQMKRDDQLTAYKIHKISPDLLLQKKPFQSHASEVINFLKDTRLLVGHNVLFDWEFLINAFKKVTKDGDKSYEQMLIEKDFLLIDTHKMSIVAFPKLQGYRVLDVANHLGIESGKKQVASYSVSSPKRKKQEQVKIVHADSNDALHDAMMDSLVTKEIFVECFENIAEQSMKADHRLLADPRYTYPSKNLELIDKAINMQVSPYEMRKLVEIAENTMSSLKYSKGQLLKEISTKILSSEIKFLEKRNGVANKRELKLRRILEENKLVEASTVSINLNSIDEQREADETLLSFVEENQLALTSTAR